MTLCHFMTVCIIFKNMSVLKDARQKAGCDTEELWFHQRERELIDKMKKNERRLKLVEGGRASKDENSDSADRPSSKSAGPPGKKAA